MGGNKDFFYFNIPCVLGGNLRSHYVKRLSQVYTTTSP